MMCFRYSDDMEYITISNITITISVITDFEYGKLDFVDQDVTSVHEM